MADITLFELHSHSDKPAVNFNLGRGEAEAPDSTALPESGRGGGIGRIVLALVGVLVLFVALNKLRGSDEEQVDL
jgi:hypothetical protein